VDFPGECQKYCCRGGKSSKIKIPLFENKTTFKKCDGKMSNFKILGRPWPLFRPHAPKTSYGKKAEEDNKNIFTNKYIMIFEKNIR